MRDREMHRSLDGPQLRIDKRPKGVIRSVKTLCLNRGLPMRLYNLVRRLVEAGSLALATGLALLTTAQEPAAAPSEADAAKAYQARAKEIVASYGVTAGIDERPLDRPEEPILRWSNPLGGRQAHGEVFLWTDRGRPAAVLSMYQYTDSSGVVHEHHEWCSLALGPVAAIGPKTWRPDVAGVELKPMPDAAGPADSPTRRLRQMRELAARFTAKKTTRQKETRDLRILPQPAYRYASSDPDVQDGAIFALVEATDPEIFLLLETRAVDGQPAWHYAFARMNSIHLEASLADRQVWLADVLPWRDALNRSDLPYTAFTIK
jgi:hypothetical protein